MNINIWVCYKQSINRVQFPISIFDCYEINKDLKHLLLFFDPVTTILHIGFNLNETLHAGGYPSSDLNWGGTLMWRYIETAWAVKYRFNSATYNTSKLLYPLS